MVVARATTASVFFVGPLPEWETSPEYVAVMLTFPWFMLGVKVTEQLPVIPRTQLAAGAKVPELAGVAVKETVPDGTTCLPPSVSVTVAVQVAGTPVPIEPGLQLKLVVEPLRRNWPWKGRTCERTRPL